MKKLFYHSYSATALNIGMLVLRVGFGILMIPGHGWAKLASFDAQKEQFVSFMGLSPALSLGLAVFAEFFCSLLIIAGLFTRLATIPLIITMLVAINMHKWQIFGDSELAPAFLFAYITLFLIGPGKYSLDAMVSKR